MKLQTQLSIVLMLSGTICLAGWTSNSESNRMTRLEQRVEQQDKKIQDLNSKMLQLSMSAPAAAPANVVTAATAPAAPASDASAPVLPQLTNNTSFSDTSGAYGEKQISDLAKLGVLDTSSGKFEPTKPVTRAEFVSWLIKANNSLRQDKAVRLAEADAVSSFPDLKTSNPYFKYVQGMSSAGWSIGYDDNTFKPDKVLTREEMIAIKAPFDDEYKFQFLQIGKWSDCNKISKRFQVAMSSEAGDNANWQRCFGNTKICEPLKPVSRAEAAICVWQLGSQGHEVNAGSKT